MNEDAIYFANFEASQVDPKTNKKARCSEAVDGYIKLKIHDVNQLLVCNRTPRKKKVAPVDSDEEDNDVSGSDEDFIPNKRTVRHKTKRRRTRIQKKIIATPIVTTPKRKRRRPTHRTLTFSDDDETMEPEPEKIQKEAVVIDFRNSHLFSYADEDEGFSIDQTLDDENREATEDNRQPAPQEKATEVDDDVILADDTIEPNVQPTEQPEAVTEEIDDVTPAEEIREVTTDNIQLGHQEEATEVNTVAPVEPQEATEDPNTSFDSFDLDIVRSREEMEAIWAEERRASEQLNESIDVFNEADSEKSVVELGPEEWGKSVIMDSFYDEVRCVEEKPDLIFIKEVFPPLPPTPPPKYVITLDDVEEPDFLIPIDD